MEIIIKELEKSFKKMKKSGKDSFDVKVGFPKCTLTVTPVDICGEIPHDIKDAEFFMVKDDLSTDGDLHLDSFSIKELAGKIAHLEEKILKNEKSKKDLKAFYETIKNRNTKDPDWDRFSDWHKDVYGFRPNGEKNLCA